VSRTTKEKRETEAELEALITEHPDEIPGHVGVVLDGNRRWAREHHLPLEMGHRQGSIATENICRWSRELGIKIMTMYLWSTENFKRDPKQVAYMMVLFEKQLQRLVHDKEIHRDRIKVRILGKKSLLPQRVQQAIVELEEATNSYDGFLLNICMGYGGRLEIADACIRIVQEVQEGKLKPEQIDEDCIKQRTYFTGPDPDIIIRTGGSQRLSNFLLWHAAYSELYFEPKYLPAIERIDFLRAIREFQLRQRRFGE
jgi:tritrans,polycis-undecaprenyl-diphosphate synthase [geranylgeranyl-diphosphate specific]